MKGQALESKFEDKNIEIYYYKIKNKIIEVSILSWMPHEKYNNIIIKKIRNNDIYNIILNDEESLIWKSIVEDTYTVEQLVKSLNENNIGIEKLLKIINDLSCDGLVSFRTNGVWDEEGE
jgi:hypothetical protein